MRKKIIIILIPLIILGLLILSIVAFYSVPFVKANSLLVSANKSETINVFDDDDSFISQDNYNKLRIIGREIYEDEYVRLKTSKKYDFINWKNVDLICSVNTTVVSFDKNVVSDSYTKELIISFSFIKGKWIVSNVDIID